MSGDNQITIGSYIRYSLKAALKLVKLNPNSMEYFDLSSDGFWKSFWAIAVMVPGLVMVSMFQYQGVVNQASPEETMAYPFLSNVVFFSLALPFTAFVMAYFTKFMKIDEHYPSMVIAYNWMSALVYLIMVILTVILGSGILSNNISGVILTVVGFYFSIYIHWFTFKVGLQISGALAIGVLIFVKLLDASLIVILFKVLDPDYFEMIMQAINSQPS